MRVHPKNIFTTVEGGGGPTRFFYIVTITNNSPIIYTRPSMMAV